MTSLDFVSCRTFLFFSRYGVIYYSTHARKNEIYLMLENASKKRENVLLLCDVIRDLTLIAHAKEPMKLLHLYELWYNCRLIQYNVITYPSPYKP